MSSQSQYHKLVVLITGATGYIGGSVLSRLLSLPNAHSKYEFRAIVRNADKAKILEEKFGVKAIVGSHSDQGLMEKEASEADVVLAMADCDDVDAAGGINKGLKKKFEATGKRPILVHTTGAAVLNDTAVGEFTSEEIYDDENVQQLETISPDALHRLVDLKVLEADEAVDAGVANSRTIIFKMLVPPAVKRGYGIIVGKGENVWLNVHIDEAAEFYVLMFTSVLDDSKNVPHGREGYLFLGAEEHKAVQYYNEVSKVLFELGKVKSPDPRPLGEDEAVKHFGPWGAVARVALGGNARFVGNRARKLGWVPVKGTQEFIASLRKEVGYWLETLD
ncbi:hypothetical protein AAF712_011412 [Marasmius tenuissimus]|uniref:NmrA-like domain-containing protein n=1 Tax=Marasmius tenuissimus TaxID=585030 RepID=A0ABR2ZLA0_9AGAR